jgi:hypothetical protein
LFEKARNCRFIGGIFERGDTNDYQVEVPDGNRAILLRDLEVNAATKAAIGVTGGELAVRDVHFSLSANCAAAEVTAGSLNVRSWTASGKEGRSQLELFKGKVEYL